VSKRRCHTIPRCPNITAEDFFDIEKGRGTESGARASPPASAAVHDRQTQEVQNGNLQMGISEWGVMPPPKITQAFLTTEQ
jgi:hypothetical protein